MELAGIERKGLAEPVFGAGPEQQVVGGRFIQAEHPDLAGDGGVDQGAVAVAQVEGVDAARTQTVDAGIAGLGADHEAGQVVRSGDAGQLGIDIDRDRNAGVGGAEIVASAPFGQIEQGVEHVRPSRFHQGLRMGPVGGAQMYLRAGLARPEFPEVDQIALQAAVLGAKDVRRVIVIDGDSQSGLAGQGDATRERQPGRHQQPEWPARGAGSGHATRGGGKGDADVHAAIMAVAFRREQGAPGSFGDRRWCRWRWRK